MQKPSVIVRTRIYVVINVRIVGETFVPKMGFDSVNELYEICFDKYFILCEISRARTHSLASCRTGVFNLFSEIHFRKMENSMLLQQLISYAMSCATHNSHFVCLAESVRPPFTHCHTYCTIGCAMKLRLLFVQLRSGCAVVPFKYLKCD